VDDRLLRLALVAVTVLEVCAASNLHTVTFQRDRPTPGAGRPEQRSAPVRLRESVDVAAGRRR